MNKMEMQIYDPEKIIKILEYEELVRSKRGLFRFIDSWKLVLLQTEYDNKILLIDLIWMVFHQQNNQTDALLDYLRTKANGGFTLKKERQIDPRDRFEYVDNSKSSDYIDKDHIIQWKENL